MPESTLPIGLPNLNSPHSSPWTLHPFYPLMSQGYDKINSHIHALANDHGFEDSTENGEIPELESGTTGRCRLISSMSGYHPVLPIRFHIIRSSTSYAY
jgi:hypothetical protein